MSARISPEVGLSKPHMTFSKVVFPTPDAPTMATLSPAAMRISKSLKIGRDSASY